MMRLHAALTEAKCIALSKILIPKRLSETQSHIKVTTTWTVLRIRLVSYYPRSGVLPQHSLLAPLLEPAFVLLAGSSRPWGQAAYSSRGYWQSTAGKPTWERAGVNVVFAYVVYSSSIHRLFHCFLLESKKAQEKLNFVETLKIHLD
jgi:hypothetical protein